MNTANTLALRCAATLLVVLVSSACGRQEAPTQARGGPPVTPVLVQQVIKKPWVDEIQALGTAQARESVTISAKVTETVERINFRDGQQVEAGEVLVELTGRAEVARLEEARAAWQEAEQQYRRMTELVRQGTVTQAQVDQQRALRDAAQARMDAIRAGLADRVITAPFSGVLGFRQVSAGALVSPGTPITTLDDIAAVYLDFSVPEVFIGALAPGQTIRARSAAFPGREFEGTVTSVGSRVDPVARAVMVRAEISNPELLIRPGMLLTVDLVRDARHTLVLPELALVPIGERQYVYKLREDGTVEQVEVALGSRRAGEVEVLAGLTEGDVVVTEGTVRVRSGSRVEVRNPGALAG